MATLIKNEVHDEVLTITFYEEEIRKPCTLDWDNIAELEHILDSISLDQVKVVVIQSDSSKSFIVGANISVLQTLDADTIQVWVRNGHAVFSKLQKLPVPVIAKVESYALGGGLELAMCCDFIIAAEQAVFAQPEASLGVMPGWGASYRLAKLVGPNRAKEMLFTGKKISASQAYEWGLVNHVCTKETIDEFVSMTIKEIVSNDARVIGYVKEIIQNHTEPDSGTSAFNESLSSSVCMNSESTKTRLRDFFGARQKKK